MHKKVQCWLFHSINDAARTKNIDEVSCLLLETTDARGKFWQPVTGSVEANEGFFEGACREISEETQLALKSPPLDTGYEFQYTSRFGPTIERTFGVIVEEKKEPIIDPKEHQAFQWINPKQAMQLLRFDSNKEGLKQALRQLFQITLMVCLFSLSGFAAQDALVIIDKATIYSEPRNDSTVLEEKKVGDILRISSTNKDGWYKVRIANGKYGWIYQRNVSTEEVKNIPQGKYLERQNRVHEPRVQREYPWLYLKLAATSGLLASPDLNEIFGRHKDVPYYTYGLWGELNAAVSPKTRIGIRLMGLLSLRSFTRMGVDYDAQFMGFPLLAGVDTEYYEGTRWSFNIGVYAGLSILHHLTVAASTASAPNSFTIYNAEKPWAALLSFSGKYHLSAESALFIELAWFYTYSKLLRINSGGFNGSSAFSQDGKQKELRIFQFGPIASLGFEFTL
ncbi:MAG: NUDIX domain-containing protein [Bacteriovoracia bacterium]